MWKSETLQGGPLSRRGRIEAAIIKHLQSQGDFLPPTDRPKKPDALELTAAQKTNLLRLFRDIPDIPEGGSKDDLPILEEEESLRWARD